MSLQEDIALTITALKGASAQKNEKAVANLEKSLAKLVQQAKAEQGVKDNGITPLRHIAQGATFGFADEIEGGYRNLMPEAVGGREGGYSHIRDQIRAENAAERKDSPWATAGYEVGGSLPTGILGANRMAASNMLRNSSPFKKMSTIGGTEGGIYGAGLAEELSDLPGNILKEGAIGAVTNLIAEPLAKHGGEMIGSGMDWLKNKWQQTPHVEAQNIIGDPELSNLSVDDIIERYGANREHGGVIADTDQAFRDMGQVKLQTMSPEAYQAREFLTERDLGQNARLTGISEDATGSTFGSTQGSLDEIHAATSAEVKPLYEQFYDRDLDLEDILKDFHVNDLNAGALDAPDDGTIIEAVGDAVTPEMGKTFENALKQARKNQIDELSAMDSGFGDPNFDPAAYELQFKRTGSVSRLLDLTKRQLDSQINVAKRKGDGERVRVLQMMKSKLVDKLDAIAPEWAQARSIYTDRHKLDEAAEIGYNIFSGRELPAKELLNQVETPGERKMLMKGVMDAVKEQFNNAGASHDSIKKVFNKQKNIDLLKQAFNDDDKFAKFMNDINREIDFRSTKDSLGNSATFSRFKINQQMDEAAGGPNIAQYLESTQTGGVSTLLNMLRGKGLSPEGEAELIKFLYTPNMSDELIRDYMSRAQIPGEMKKTIGDILGVVGEQLGGAGGAYIHAPLRNQGILNEDESK
jgi:hypothetical protein